MAVAIIDNDSIHKNLKHVDPSIVRFSTSTDMTRYDKADLYSIKDNKLSQEPPRCYYEPNIIRLNIFKYQTQHTEEIEAQMKVFREKLQNLTLASWDPNLLQLLKNYHNALLNPNSNGYPTNIQQQSPVLNQISQMQQPQFQSSRRVSFSDKQQAVLDKIPSYDRNMNFFDNITTTATMRPPPRMGVNSYNNNYYHKRQNQNYLRKPNSCANEHANSYGSSIGYFSGNDTRSSCEESLFEKQCEKKMSVFDQINIGQSNINKLGSVNANEDEKEPEWFNVPATLNDFVDLHGFEDDDGKDQKESNGSTDDKQSESYRSSTDFEKSKNQSYQSQNSSFHNDYRRNSHNLSYNRYNNNNQNGYSGYGVNHNRNTNYYKQNQNYNSSQMNNSTNNNQRFRNPLHFSKSARPNTPSHVNPFFDAWRNGKLLNHQSVSFSELMEEQNKRFPNSMPSSVVHMSEIENRMKQQQNLNGINQVTQPSAVPQFFQNLANNWGVRVNENPINNFGFPQQQMSPQLSQQLQNLSGGGAPIHHDGYKMPTQEELQKFTSEIMRNAILRKNQQQYHDENNNYQ